MYRQEFVFHRKNCQPISNRYLTHKSQNAIHCYSAIFFYFTFLVLLSKALYSDIFCDSIGNTLRLSCHRIYGAKEQKNYTFNIEFKSPDFWSNVNVFSVFVFLSVWRKNTNTSVKSIFFCFYGIMPQMVQAILLDITLHQKWISFTWIRIVYDTQISIIWSDMYSVECILCTSCVCAYINQKMKNIAPNKKHFRFQKISSLKPK